MAESFKSKRVIFPANKQREFVIESKKSLDLTWNELADFLNISTRNLTDWKNEKNSMPLKAIEIICKKSDIKFPVGIQIKDPYWYTKKGARKGGLVMYRKYGAIGDLKIRKARWHEWWNKKGKYEKREILKPLPFKKPRYSAKLAEFVGIMLGDGGISDRQIVITLHRITDEEYAGYLIKLIKELFEVNAAIYKSRTSLANDYVVSRTGLVNYCVKKLGLAKGNKVKNKVDIPGWIKKNNLYKIACLRGLIDTDGSVIIHKYGSGGKYYIYKKISFCSRSMPLLLSASMILDEIGIKNRMTKNRFEIRIEAKESVKKYFKLVKTHNPKHLKRFIK